MFGPYLLVMTAGFTYLETINLDDTIFNIVAGTVTTKPTCYSLKMLTVKP